MDIDVTDIIEGDTDLCAYSDSIANSGLSNIGEVTWRNACEATADEGDYICADRDALVAHFKEYGAWLDLETWPLSELNALLLQDIAGAYAEIPEGEVQDIEGRLSKCDDGRWYFYLGI